jgi:hypothetical protein
LLADDLSPVIKQRKRRRATRHNIRGRHESNQVSELLRIAEQPFEFRFAEAAEKAVINADIAAMAGWNRATPAGG